MRQNVAVVDKARKLHQLIFGDLEVRVRLHPLIVLIHRPPYAQDGHAERMHQCSVLPSPIVLGNGGSSLLAEVFIDVSERAILVCNNILLADLLQDVKA
jgi:hypothetical protein